MVKGIVLQNEAIKHMSAGSNHKPQPHMHGLKLSRKEGPEVHEFLLPVL